MNQRLEEEINAYLEEKLKISLSETPRTWKITQVVAQHFYNLALEDVKKEVEKNLKELNDRHEVLNRGEIQLYQKKILNFIEKQEV